MVKKAGGRGTEPVHVTVAMLMESLRHIEWEARHVRLALQRLDPATKIAATPEMAECLAQEPRKPNSFVPPC